MLNNPSFTIQKSSEDDDGIDFNFARSTSTVVVLFIT